MPTKKDRHCRVTMDFLAKKIVTCPLLFVNSTWIMYDPPGVRNISPPGKYAEKSLA
jgi:hypothetical protein